MRVLLAIALAVTALPAHPPTADSIAALSHRIEHEPDNAELYLRRGELYRSERRWEAALADYRKSAELAPDSADVERCVGRLQLEAGRPEAALPALDRFLKRRPGDATGLELRGRAHDALGRHAEAAADLGAAVERVLAADARPRPALVLARAEAERAAGLPTRDVLARLEAALELLGGAVSLELKALEIEIAAGHHDEALRRLERLADSSARPETWLARRAALLERTGRNREALAAHRATLEAIRALPPARRGVPAVARLEREALERARRLEDSF